jgi:hypothetical protein
MPAPPTESAIDPVTAAGRHPMRWMTLAVMISWLSMAMHNLFELPISPLAPEYVGPLAVALLCLAAHVARPGWRVPLVALVGWAALNLVGGAIISVLPLPFLPFEPEQSLGHYLTHIVYGLGQVPLLVAGWLALVRTGRRRRPATIGVSRSSRGDPARSRSDGAVLRSTSGG